MKRLVLLAALLCTPAWGHSLIPMRLEAESGTKAVIAVFTIQNRFKFQNRFAIDCFKGEKGDNRIECQSIPEVIILSPNASRKVKVKMPVQGDGIYRVCSIEDPAENEERPIITRLCALVGVGVSPYTSTGIRPKHRTATNAVAAGSRQNKIR